MLSYSISLLIVNTLFCVIILVKSNSFDHSRPRLDRFIEQKTQNQGTTLKLFCSIQEGTKPLHFEWTKNGKSLAFSLPKNYRIETNEDDSLLIIEQLISEDSGNYSCRVWNDFGEDIQYSQLIVKGLIGLSNFKYPMLSI